MHGCHWPSQSNCKYIATYKTSLKLYVHMHTHIYTQIHIYIHIHAYTVHIYTDT